MKIVNFKLNYLRILLIALAIIGGFFVLLSLKCFLDFATSKEIIMDNSNYTKVLKECHENPTEYLNKEVYAIGYVFRANDFKEDEFVLARDMLINKSEAQIVGFLVHYSNASELEDNVWVEVRGKIKLGDYHGEIPIIEVKSLKKITTPEDIYVYPPAS